MANSKVDICNLALSLIGERTIVSFSDNNNRSRLSDTLYNQARDTVLSLFDWPFARAFKKLQQLSDVDLPSELYGYRLPIGCTHPRKLYPRESNLWFEIQGDMLVTKTDGDQYLYYSVLVDDPTKYGALFITAVADLLAAWLAHPLTGDKKLATQKMEMFNMSLNNATSIEANKGNSYRRSDEDPDKDTFVNPSPNLSYEDYRGL